MKKKKFSNVIGVERAISPQFRAIRTRFAWNLASFWHHISINGHFICKDDQQTKSELIPSQLAIEFG